MPRPLTYQGECEICLLPGTIYKTGHYRGLCGECTRIAQENPD